MKSSQRFRNVLDARRYAQNPSHRQQEHRGEGLSMFNTSRLNSIARTDTGIVELLGRGFGLLRCAIGISALFAPTLPARPWVGKDEAKRTSVKLFARTLGVRDLALGLGAMLTPNTRRGLSSWVVLGALADAGDFLATIAAFKKLPRWSRWLILALTLGASLVGGGLGMLLTKSAKDKI